jgi:hypothetical protein
VTCLTCTHWRQYKGHLSARGSCDVAPVITFHDFTCKAHTMPLKPRIKVKARGIPIGADYATSTDETGKVKVKPKKKRRSLPQEIAAKKRKRWKAAT